MEWRIIPGYPAYEISESGTVRKTGTGYQLTKSGRRYGLWDGKQRRYFYPYELTELAFDTREDEAAAKPTALERENLELREMVAELEAELLVYRVAI